MFAPDKSANDPPVNSLATAQIPLSWELFCSELALGETAVSAAKKIGYSYDYAADLSANPIIQERLNQYILARARDGLASRLWCELQLFKIAKDASEDRPEQILADGSTVPFRAANPPLAMQALMNVCKLKGYIVERKQTLQGKIDLTADNELAGALEETLAVLSPEDRARIRDLSAGRRKRKTSVPSARSSAVVVDVPSSSKESK